MNDSEAFSKYLTYSDRDIQWQIYCTCVGFSKVSHGARYPFRPKLGGATIKLLARTLSFTQQQEHGSGVSPYQYFLHLKINRAKDLIAEGEYSIKEIAYMLSFENQYYFSRLFKSKTGVPPSQWHT